MSLWQSLQLRHRRLWLWLVMAAVSFAALAPAVSQWLVSAGAPAWVQVCSAQGMRWVQATAPGLGQPDDGSGTTASHDTCHYCQLSHHGAAPPPAAAPALLSPSAARVMPERFLSAAATSPVWLSAQPRAPPALA
jgi:hypothetical protein